MNAVDTNILLYSVDKKEPIKQAKADLLLDRLVNGSEITILLWQALTESAQQLRRWMNQGRLTEVEIGQHLHYFRKLFPLVLPTAPVLDQALDLASRYSLSHWDSMVLGACKEANVDVFYTEDMGSPTKIDGIQLMNPFT